MKSDPRDSRLKNIQRRFRALHARLDSKQKRREALRDGKTWLLAAAVFVAVLTGLLMSPWPVPMTLRHVAALPNCAAARIVGLAPSERGEAGYWPWHDADDDGTACEPRPQNRR